MKRVLGFFLRFLFIILALAGAGAAWFYFDEAEPEESEKSFVPVRAEQPVRRDVEEILEVHGNLESSNQVTILPKVSGSVTSLYANVGDTVKEGEILAEIDREAYRLEKERADIAFNSASSTWTRINRLYNSGSATRQNWEDARAAYLSAEAQASAAALRYGWTRVPSPTTGVVLMKHTAVGSLVSPEAGTPLYTIGSLETLEADLFIPEEYLAAFNGQTPDVRIAPEAFPDLILDAEISTVAPWVDPVTRSFVVTCRIPPDEAARGGLRPGMLMTARFILSVRRNVLTLPSTALTSGKGFWFVNSEGKASYQALEGARIIGSYVLLPDSMEGRTCVTVGQHFLSEGTDVRILNREGESKSEAPRGEKIGVAEKNAAVSEAAAGSRIRLADVNRSANNIRGSGAGAEADTKSGGAQNGENLFSAGRSAAFVRKGGDSE